MTDIRAPKLGAKTKLAGSALLVLIALAAIFNVRLGFGAQTVDCIDGFVHLVRFNTPASINKNDYIVFVAPDHMGGKFKGHLVIKKVGAVAGDTIRVDNGKLYVNDTFVNQVEGEVTFKAAKFLGVSEASFNRTETVPSGYVLAIGTKPRSYDGRYWGILPISNVVGTAYQVF